jgi:hypothetical protein
MKTLRFNAKQRGELAELAFIHRAASLGLAVCLPLGDSNRFDLVVLDGPKVSRIQIKSANWAHSGGSLYRINCHRRVGHAHSTKVAYSATEIDFLVAYVRPDDDWYFFPPEFFTRNKNIILYPRSSRYCDRYALYRDRWDLLFQEPPPGLTLHASAQPLLLPLTQPAALLLDTEPHPSALVIPALAGI